MDTILEAAVRSAPAVVPIVTAAVTAVFWYSRRRQRKYMAAVTTAAEALVHKNAEQLLERVGLLEELRRLRRKDLDFRRRIEDLRDMEQELRAERSNAVEAAQQLSAELSGRDVALARLSATAKLSASRETVLEAEVADLQDQLHAMAAASSEPQQATDLLVARTALKQAEGDLQRKEHMLVQLARTNGDLENRLLAADDEIGVLRRERTLAAEKNNRELEARLADRERELSAIRKGQDRFRDVVEVIERGPQKFWIRDPHPPMAYRDRLRRSIPIVMIGNLKGGVGKTTLAANLAAYYHENGKRVLLIDLDYQGSLSAMAAGYRTVRRQETTQSELLFQRKSVTPLAFRNDTRSGVIDCFYRFADLETSLMVRWLGDPEGHDVRYILAEYLQDPVVQERWDAVIIDSAPRVSTAFVNAFCAATHLLIPTRLDVLSAETVESFLTTRKELMDLRRGAPLSYQVVGTMKATDTESLAEHERNAVRIIREIIERVGDPTDRLLEDAFVPTRAAFSKDAGLDVAYFRQPEVRVFMGRLARKLAPFIALRVEEDA